MDRIEQLLKDWHEAGRKQFESTYDTLIYDDQCEKTAVQKRRYICLDEHSSGAFLVDKTDGTVYRIKSKYGVPNKKKVCGNIETITGETLNKLRWW